MEDAKFGIFSMSKHGKFRSGVSITIVWFSSKSAVRMPPGVNARQLSSSDRIPLSLILTSCMVGESTQSKVIWVIKELTKSHLLLFNLWKICMSKYNERTQGFSSGL